MLELDTAPPHLVIVGGSYVGLDFGQMFRRFGSEVTIVEMGPRLVQREDHEISSAIQDFLTTEGINLRLKRRCIRLGGRAGAVLVHVYCQDGSLVVEGTHLLLSVGREPKTGRSGLEAAGVSRDERGIHRRERSAGDQLPGIWGLGDRNGKGSFTQPPTTTTKSRGEPARWRGSRRLRSNSGVCALHRPAARPRGDAETEAQRSGRTILVGKCPISRVGRAIQKGETTGLRVIVDVNSREILGAAVLGTGGDEAIHCVLDTMYAKAPDTVLQRAMHIHPTVAELIPTIRQELALLALNVGHLDVQLFKFLPADWVRQRSWPVASVLVSPRLDGPRTSTSEGSATSDSERSVAALEQRCHEMLDAAYASGIRYVDAARSYGMAENFLSSWLKTRNPPKAAITIGSKWGYSYVGSWQLDAPVHEVKDLSVDTLRRQIAESRALLGDRLQLYEIHSATIESKVLENTDVLRELQRLHSSGLVIGLTVTGPHQADVIRRALSVSVDGVNPFQVVQATWNLLERSAAPALAEAHANGWGVIIKEALANGRPIASASLMMTPHPFACASARAGAAERSSRFHVA